MLIEKIKTRIDDDMTACSKKRWALAREWADFVKGFEPFTLYGHFTFREDVHPEKADKTWMLFLHKLNRLLFGVHYYKRSNGVYWIRATEYQKRGVLHYHALIGGLPESLPGGMSRFQLMDWWNLHAGFARIYDYRANGGAAGYITKSAYAWKNGDIDVSDSLTRSGLALQDQNKSGI